MLAVLIVIMKKVVFPGGATIWGESEKVVFLDLSFLNSTGAHYLGKDLLNSTSCILVFLSIILIERCFM